MDEAGFSINMKVGTTMITVRADDADDLIKNLGRMADVLGAVVEAQEQVSAVQTVTEAFQPTVVVNGAEDAPQGAQQFDMCAQHNVPKDKWVPAGVSSRTGKPYKGFWACPENHRG